MVLAFTPFSECSLPPRAQLPSRLLVVDVGNLAVDVGDDGVKQIVVVGEGRVVQ
jgi:hypothetical protein